MLTMDAISYHCSMCYFTSRNYSTYCQHVVRLHKHDPNFIVHCSIGSCAYSTKSWNAFKLHVGRKHKTISDDNSVIAVPGYSDWVRLDQNLEVDSDTNEEDSDLEHSVEKAFSNAMFLMQLESRFLLPKVAIDSVISSVSCLLRDHQNLYKSEIIKALNGKGLNGRDLVGRIDVDDKFDMFKTDHLRQKFYSSFCSLISPVEVMLGTVPKLKEGRIHQTKRFGYIIPLFDSLQSLFNMPEIEQYMENGHCSRNGEYMFDLCDGEQFQKNRVYSENPNAIQIILNTDDIEIVNPLGSHVKKHKLSMFYYSLGNIPPEFRSRLTCIQLVAVAKTADLKKLGIERLLSDFVESVAVLATDGKSFHIRNVEKTLHGTVLLAPCDTPAAGWLGGFKEGVGFAYRCCRTCDISSDDLKSKLYSDPEIMRSAEAHLERCDALANLSSQAKNYWSKMWGINGTSSLCKIPDLNLPVVLVHDPMHVLLEGIIRHELRLFLLYCVHSEKLFSLKWLNTRLSCFEYPLPDKRNKPQTIDNVCLKPNGKLKQTAVEIYTLICVLPFIVGPKICRGDQKWVHLLQLLQITLLSLSSCISRQTPEELKSLIYIYLVNFKRCYPRGKFLPKMHFLTHFPEQMLNYGPLRNQWCMRFEGKHGFFKKFKWTNFRNLPLSVSQKHQQWLCYKQLGYNGRRNENFLYEGDKIGSGTEIIIPEIFPSFENMFPSDKGFLVEDVNIHGHNYFVGCILILRIGTLPQTPVLGIIKHIIVVDNIKFFLCCHQEIMDFDEHYNAYVVQESEEFEVIQYSQLTFKWPEYMHVVAGRRCVMLRHSPFVEDLGAEIYFDG